MNFGPQIAEFGPTKIHFWDAIFQPLWRAACALKVLHALEIEAGLIAHTPRGTGVPPKNVIVKI